MLKLYKKTNHGAEYWEAWDADGEVMVHWGTVGDRGQTQSIKVEAGKNPNTIIKCESKRPEGSVLSWMLRQQFRTSWKN